MVARRASASRGSSRDRDNDRGSRRGRDEERGSRGGRDRDDDRGGRDRDRDNDRDERSSSRRDRDRDRDEDRGSRGGRSGRGKGGGFVYKPRDPEATKKKAERQGGNFDSIVKSNVDVWRPKSGDNLIRILPPTWDNHDDCVYTIWLHKYVGPDESTYLCPRKMLNKHCPICAEAKACNDAGDKEGAKVYRAGENVAMWIIDRDDKTDPPMPAFYTMSERQWRDIIKVSIDKKKGSVLTIDHPDEGYDLSIFRSGSGQRTRYSGFAFDRDKSPIDDDEGIQNDILEFAEKNPIPDVLNYYDEDYLDNVISGTQPERDRDAGDDRGKDDDNGDDKDRDGDRGSSRRGSRDRDDDGDRGSSRRGSRNRDRDDDKDRDNDDGNGADEGADDDNGNGADEEDDNDKDNDRGGRSERRGSREDRDNDPPPPRRNARRGSSGERGGRSERRYRD